MIAALLGLALAAAAPSEASHHPATVFLSPSGEPFRHTPGGALPFEAWFAAADADHDGALSRAEFAADADAFFRRVDANGDGKVDGFEVSAYERHIAPELIMAAEAPARSGPGEPGGPSRRARYDWGDGRGGHYEALLNEPEPVAGADFDLDSRITKDEWRRAADRRFDLLDKTHTGKLERAALAARLEAARPKERSRGGERRGRMRPKSGSLT